MVRYVEKSVEIDGTEEFIISAGSKNPSIHLARDPKYYKDGVSRCGIRGPGGAGWKRATVLTTPICRVCYDAYSRQVAYAEREEGTLMKSENPNLSTLQARVSTWVAYNFPDYTLGQSLHGMVEEFGEFLNSKTPEDRIDAIADFTIYAAGYCFANKLDLQSGYVDAGEQVPALNHHGELVDALVKTLGRISHNHLKSEQKIRGSIAGMRMEEQQLLVGETIRLMEEFHQRIDPPGELTFLGSVFMVWDQVEKRDWRKYPQSGLP